jgi:hypothetical protein
VEGKTKPVLCFFKFSFVCIGHIGKSKFVVSIEKVGSVKKVELRGQTVLVMRPF